MILIVACLFDVVCVGCFVVNYLFVALLVFTSLRFVLVLVLLVWFGLVWLFDLVLLFWLFVWMFCWVVLE